MGVISAIAFFEHSHELLSIISFEGDFKLANPAWGRLSEEALPKLLAERQSGLVGCNLKELIHPDDSEKTLAAINEALSGGESRVHFETRYITGIGTERILRWDISFEKETRCLHAVARDITDEFLMVKHLSENLPGAVYRFVLGKDRSMKFLLLSEGIHDVFELDRNELIKDFGNALNAIVPEDRESLIEEIIFSARCLFSFRWEGRITTPSGKIKWVQAISKPVAQPNGDTIYNGILLDITSTREAQLELEKEKAKSLVAAKMATLGEMAAGIAHEINNPLAIICANSEIIEELCHEAAPDLSTIRARTSKIKQTSNRISQIIRGLRAFARDASEDPFEIKTLQAIVTDTLEFCHARFDFHQVPIILGAASPDLDLECRPVQISQVILNLLINAFDAVAGTPNAWVRLETSATGGNILIAVTDSGRGIPSEIAEKIMQPFFTTKEVGKGTGLGLSISRGIVENHGGSLYLDTACENTRFIIRLPRSQTAVSDPKNPQAA